MTEPDRNWLRFIPYSDLPLPCPYLGAKIEDPEPAPLPASEVTPSLLERRKEVKWWRLSLKTLGLHPYTLVG